MKRSIVLVLAALAVSGCQPMRETLAKREQCAELMEIAKTRGDSIRIGSAYPLNDTDNCNVYLGISR